MFLNPLRWPSLGAHAWLGPLGRASLPFLSHTSRDPCVGSLAGGLMGQLA